MNEIEQLRVQLAGCGVAAMQNTLQTVTQRIKKGDYGWSASYDCVCKAVDREMILCAEIDQLKRAIDKYNNAIKILCKGNKMTAEVIIEDCMTLPQSPYDQYRQNVIGIRNENEKVREQGND